MKGKAGVNPEDKSCDGFSKTVNFVLALYSTFPFDNTGGVVREDVLHEQRSISRKT